MKKKVSLMKNVVLIAAASMSLSAWAGREGHGGGAVFCPGKDPVILDYYQSSQVPKMGGALSRVVSYSGFSAEQVVQSVRNRLINFPKFVEQFDQAGAIVGSIKDWIPVSLKRIDDTREPYALPQGCEYRQAAIRQKKNIYKDPSVVDRLSPAQQGLLMVHERLYWIATDRRGETDSVDVRELMDAILNVTSGQADLSAAIEQIGGDTTTQEEYAPYVHYRTRVRAELCLGGKTADQLQATAYRLFDEGDKLYWQSRNGARRGISTLVSALGVSVPNEQMFLDGVTRLCDWLSKSASTD